MGIIFKFVGKDMREAIRGTTAVGAEEKAEVRGRACEGGDAAGRGIELMKTLGFALVTLPVWKARTCNTKRLQWLRM